MQSQKDNINKTYKNNLNFMYKSQNQINIPILHKRTQSSTKAKTFKNTSRVKKTVKRIMTNLFPIKKNNNNNKKRFNSNYNNNNNLLLSNLNNNNNNNNNIITNKSINLKEVRSLSPQEFTIKKRFLLPPSTSNKKTLVLDLDETLVHSNFIPFNIPSDIKIQIELDNNLHDIYVLVRPYVKEFLERMSKKYELVIFTASLSKYANPLLNLITDDYCPYRLYREHCTLINTAFVKDLNRLGRDLKDVIILDNSPIAYSLNPNNGFPITSWFEDKNDYELLQIIPILEFLSYVPDVRDYIKLLVKNHQIKFDEVSKVISNYNNKLKKSFIPISLRCFDNNNNSNNNNNNNNNNNRNHFNYYINYNNNKDDIVLHKSKSSKFTTLQKKNDNNYNIYNYTIGFTFKNKKIKKKKLSITNNDINLNSFININTMRYSNNISTKKLLIKKNFEKKMYTSNNSINNKENININNIYLPLLKKKHNNSKIFNNNLNNNSINLNYINYNNNNKIRADKKLIKEQLFNYLQLSKNRNKIKKFEKNSFNKSNNNVLSKSQRVTKTNIL